MGRCQPARDTYYQKKHIGKVQIASYETFKDAFYCILNWGQFQYHWTFCFIRACFVIISENLIRNSNFSLNFLNGPHLFFGVKMLHFFRTPHRCDTTCSRGHSLSGHRAAAGWPWRGTIQEESRWTRERQKYSHPGTRGRKGWTKMECLRFRSPHTNAMLPGCSLNEFGWISYRFLFVCLIGCLCEVQWFFFCCQKYSGFQDFCSVLNSTFLLFGEDAPFLHLTVLT